MLSRSLASLLQDARKQLGLSRAELARRAGVSVRLVAELERGQRPNVSLESALTLLNEVGVSITACAQGGGVAHVRNPNAAHAERLARAAQRRKTWKGGYAQLHGAGSDPAPPRSAHARAGAVWKVSEQAFTIAAAKAAPSQVTRNAKAGAGKTASARSNPVRASGSRAR